MSAADLPDVSVPPPPAMKGDLTQGPILRTLLAFSLPTLFSNVLQTLGGTINTIWVGQLLGEGALAATANANMVMIMVFAMIFGLGSATTVKVGQHFGARDLDAVRRVSGTGIGFCVASSLVLGVAGWFLADSILHLLATPPAIRAQAHIYLRVIFATLPFGTISMMLSMTLRGVGDARTPLYAMILSTALGIALNPFLILGIGPFPQLGIAGSAIANAIGGAIGMIATIALVYRRDLPVRLRGAELAYLLPRGPELSFVVAKGIPMGAQMLVGTGAGVIMLGLVNREGMMATAAYGACLQIWSYIQMPAFAIGMAVSAMIAQNIGARQHGRVDAVTLAGVIANIVMTGALAALLLAFDRPLLALFLGAHSQAIPLAEHIQIITLWALVLSGVTSVLSGALRAHGVVVVPLIAMIVALYPARLGFYALMRPRIGSEAVWWAYPAGSIAAVVLTVLVYLFDRSRQRAARAVETARAE